jgi:hypothetical protein
MSEKGPSVNLARRTPPKASTSPSVLYSSDELEIVDRTREALTAIAEKRRH